MNKIQKETTSTFTSWWGINGGLGEERVLALPWRVFAEAVRNWTISLHMLHEETRQSQSSFNSQIAKK